MPVEPIPTIEPVLGVDLELDPESPREDADPTEYSSKPDNEDLGENAVVVDWDPAVDPVLEISSDDPAPVGPIIALDPKDEEMAADFEDPGDDYTTDLGAP